MRNRILPLFVGCVAWSALVVRLQAQLPNPALDVIFPAGGQIGTQVNVQVGGRDLDDATRLIFSHPGIVGTVQTRPAGEFETGTPTVPNQFIVDIPVNVPVGIYEVRAVGRFGASTPRSFVVGPTRELVDAADNHQPAQAIELPFDTVVNGHADAGVIDYFRFHAESGQVIVVDCAASQLDSALLPVVTIWDANRQQRARTHQTRTGLLRFQAPSAGDYWIGIHDHVFGGGAAHIYRLQLVTRPYIVACDPVAATPGTRTTFTLHGWQLPGATTPSSYRLGDTPLQQMAVSLYVPRRDELPHANESSLMTTSEASSYTLHEWGASQSISPITIQLADQPVVAEIEPNQHPDQAQKVTLPCEISGRFFPRRDQDWVEFAAKQGDRIQIRVFSHRLGLPTDPEIFVQKVLRNEKGEAQVSQVSTDDDFRANDQRYRQGVRRALDLSHRDPVVNFVADADAAYRVGMRDLEGSSLDDPRLVYRLILERQQPDFQMLAWTQRNAVDDDKKVESNGNVVRPGGTMPLLIDVHRRGGWDGPIHVTVEGLPSGVHAEACVIAPGQTEGTVVISASRDAVEWAGPIHVIGTATLQDASIRREATGAILTSATGNVEASRPTGRATRDIVLSVASLDPAVARVDLGASPDATQRWRTAPGGKLSIPVQYTRVGTIKGELALTPQGVPAEVKAANVTLAADAQQANWEIALENNKCVPGIYTMWLRGKVATSYARNAPAIEQAIARRKAMDDVVAQLTAAAQQADTDLATAQAAATGKVEQVKQAQGAHQAAHQAVLAAGEQLSLVRQQLAALQEFAQVSADATASIQPLVEQFDQLTQQLNGQLATTRETLDALQAKLSDSNALVQRAQEAVKQAEARQKELADKRQRADAHIKTLDQQVTDAQTNGGPKDLTVYVDSTPITFEIVPTPVQATVNTTTLTITPGQAQSLTLNVERLFGFAEVISVDWELPSGIADLQGEPATLPVDQSQQALTLKAGPQAPIGRHAAAIRLSVKFNGVDSQFRVPVVIDVVAAK